MWYDFPKVCLELVLHLFRALRTWSIFCLVQTSFLTKLTPLIVSLQFLLGIRLWAIKKYIYSETWNTWNDFCLYYWFCLIKWDITSDRDLFEYKKQTFFIYGDICLSKCFLRKRDEHWCGIWHISIGTQPNNWVWGSFKRWPVIRVGYGRFGTNSYSD